MARRCCVFVVALTLAVTASPAAGREQGRGPRQPEAASASFERQATRGDAKIAHLRNGRRLAEAKVKPPQPKVKNTGDVVVIEDHGEIISPARPARPFDLVRGTSYQFRPTGGELAVTAGLEPFVFGRGEPLPFHGGERSFEVGLPFAFPFFGTLYDRVFVNLDGNVTFGVPDGDAGPTDAARLRSGPPRIAPLFAPLAADGFFLADVTGERAAFRWSTTYFDHPAGVDVQIVLFPDGTVRFGYGAALEMFHRRTVTAGLAPGGDSGRASEVDLSAAPFAVPAGVVYEEFPVVNVPFDLHGTTLSLAPATAGGYAPARALGGFAPPGGGLYEIGGGRTVEIPLDFGFRYAGATYESVFANSNGTLTFGVGDASRSGSLFRLLDGPPRLAPHLRTSPVDFSGSTVAVDTSGGQAVITFVDLPSLGGPRTFQVTLRGDGSFAFSYPDDFTGTFGTVGYTVGGQHFAYREVAWSDELPSVIPEPIAYQLFGTGFFGPLDLVSRSLVLEPEPGGFAMSSHAGGIDYPRDPRAALLGIPLTGVCTDIPCAGSQEVPLPAGFSFLGIAYDSVFVNGDGSLTFGGADPAPGTSPGELLDGPPRISPFGAALGDLFVSARLEAGRLVLNYEFVCTFEEFVCITLQVLLSADGTVRIVYGHSFGFADSARALVGVAAGGGAEPITEIDLSADLPATFLVGTVFEEFLGFGQPFATIDDVALARRFYEVNPDHFDMIVVFTDFPVSLLGGFAIAYHLPVQNQTEGIGQFLFDDSGFFGSGGELESLIQMNNVKLYWPDAERMVNPPLSGQPGPRRRVLGLGDGGPLAPEGEEWDALLHSPMSVLAHEILHRWAAYVPSPYGDGFGPHWNFYLDTSVPAGQFDGPPRASALEGNVLQDLGPTAECAGRNRFETHPEELADGYSALDQYLMGIRQAGQVGPLVHAENPSPFVDAPFGIPGPSFPGLAGVPFCADRAETAIDDVQSLLGGPRLPAVGDEDDGNGTDVKTIAFVMLTQETDPKVQAAIAKRVDTFRRTWDQYSRAATGGRGQFDTSLTPKVH